MRHPPRRRIEHLIVVVQAQRTFDDLFSGYPGASAPGYGCASRGTARPPLGLSGGCPPGDTRVPLKAKRLAAPACRLSSTFTDYFKVAWDDGRMDGWNQLDPADPLCPYTHVERSDTQKYWALARQYGIADHAFPSTHFGFFPDQLYLVAGTSEIARKAWVVGIPDEAPWGCDAPPGTVTTALAHGRIGVGPFPCFTQFPTMANLFDNAGVSWRFYYDARDAFNWNPFQAIKHVFEGQDWKRDISSPATNIFGDLTNGNLAAVSWVLSPYANSDSPGTRDGPRWVTFIVDAVMKSNYWQNTAIVVIWNNEGDGRYYDNVAPPQLDDVGLGFRVPMLVVSPYAKRHYVSHTEYEFGSLLKFMEENWNLPPLGGYATDQRASSISNMFDFGR
ncbi:MAG TPA: alkaline phosphatase family protein [Candidatus Binatia bacterium]|nr:alkaline phosphatase family protein [Candidatus Binatia bacterium]